MLVVVVVGCLDAAAGESAYEVAGHCCDIGLKATMFREDAAIEIIDRSEVNGKKSDLYRGEGVRLLPGDQELLLGGAAAANYRAEAAGPTFHVWWSETVR